MVSPLPQTPAILSLVIVKLPLQNMACRHSNLEPTMFVVIRISDVFSQQLR